MQADQESLGRYREGGVYRYQQNLDRLVQFDCADGYSTPMLTLAATMEASNTQGNEATSNWHF